MEGLFKKDRHYESGLPRIPTPAGAGKSGEPADKTSIVGVQLEKGCWKI